MGFFLFKASLKSFLQLILTFLTLSSSLTRGQGQPGTNQLTLVGRVIKEFYWTVPDPSSKGMTQADASALCQKNGMTLASISNLADQSILSSISKGKTLEGNMGYNFWLGGSDAESKGRWIWKDQTPVQFQNWNQNWGPQPRNRTEFNCMFASATYWGTGGWFDNSCSSEFLPLCMKTRTEFYGQGVSQLQPEENELKWPGICSSPTRTRQSPINLVTPPKTRVTSLVTSALRFNNEYNKIQPNFFIINDGHTVQVQLNRAPTSDLILGGVQGQTYILAQIHFHWGLHNAIGSEHTIDGRQFPGEVHFVHYKSNYPTIAAAVASGEDNALAVIGVLMDFTRTSDQANGVFRQIARAVADIGRRPDCPNEEMTLVPEAINVYNLLPIGVKDQFVHQYNGSLTTPTCDENVIWKVFNKPILVDPIDFDSFRRLECDGKPVGNNFRVVQSPLLQAVSIMRAGSSS